MKAVSLVASLLIAAGLIFCGDVFAQVVADAPPVTMNWNDFFGGLWAVVYPYISGPAVVAFLMTQARAMFPALGKLGVFTILGDFIAGNWGHAKNAAVVPPAPKA